MQWYEYAHLTVDLIPEENSLKSNYNQHEKADNGCVYIWKRNVWIATHRENC